VNSDDSNNHDPLREELEDALLLTRESMQSLARVDIEAALDAVFGTKVKADA
jgi:hypothetical protein